MKKKMIFAGVAMLLAAAAVTGFSAYSKVNASDLLNANVEALASPELSDRVWDRYDYTNDAGTACVNCLQGGSDDCVIRKS